MTNIINGILNYMISQKVIEDNEKERDFYRYGIEITISSICNIVLVVILGIISKHFFLSCIYLSEFILIRSVSGGLHAKTYVGCNAIMCISYLLLLCLFICFSEKITPAGLIISALLSIIPMSVYSPCDNPHKRIKTEKKLKFKILSIALTTIFCIIGLVLFLNNFSVGFWIIMVCDLVSLFLFIASKKAEEHKISDNS